MSMIVRIRGNENDRRNPADHRPSRPWARLMLVPTVLCWLIVGPACGENGGKSKSNSKAINDGGSSMQKNADKRMVLSSGQYNKGYQDGKRDASLSLIDANGSWMWDWMKEPEYRQGYNQGWNDGRQIKKLQGKAEVANQEAAPQPAKKKEDQSSRARIQPARKAKRVVTVDTKTKGQQ
ncbi:MAG TPA: hypothetical protein VMV94_18035 [Phycisphaerae bacterium]|nr:hypothetical protein [Phycisphaerae bacterium]